MQSTRPLPGNPWPHDMVLTVEDDSHVLLELLWIREAWVLDPVGDDLPPLLSDQLVQPPASAVPRDRVAAWRSAWPAIWDACIHHAGLIRDSTVFERLNETPGGSLERERFLRDLFGPSWREEFGDDALTEHYTSWVEARFEVQSRRHRRSLHEEPERVSLAALVPAWRAGLSKIVTIPCRGSYTRIIGAHTLLVTEETRNNPRTYSEALANFR
jgi:hypothetical protein